MKDNLLRIFNQFLRATVHLLGLVLLFSPIHIVQAQSAPEKTVLVLYDATDAYGYSGVVYSAQLANLLSHFPVTVTTSIIENYSSGMLERYDASFYLGIMAYNLLPQPFLDDVFTTTKPLCWINENLWQIAWITTETTTEHNEAFMTRFNAAYWGVDNADYRTVYYKGRALEKPAYDSFLHYLFPLDNEATTVHASALATNGTTAGYITQMQNLWFVADNPFNNVEHKDRYLAFADILYDILQIEQAPRHRALVRIEDVSPATDPIALRQIADFLAAEKVPFTVSLIAEFRNPYGEWNNGVPQTIKLTDSPAVVSALKYMQQRGGQLLLHGYTHQYETKKNPYTGLSGEDWEFYQLTLDANKQVIFEGPVPDDSPEWTNARVTAGLNAMAEVGLTPIGWNTPHYFASPVNYTEFARMFPLHFCRGLYYSDPATPTESNFLQQIAPYVFQRDYFGAKRIPETLGYFDSFAFPDDPVGEIAARAEANLVVRDGWASFYFHPFLDPLYLKQTVRRIKALGYTYVRVTQDIE